MSPKQKLTYVLALLLAIEISLFVVPHSLNAYAQEMDVLGVWSPPIDLSMGMEGYSRYPTIIADPAGGLHVFWDETINDGVGIISWVDYTYWDGIQWSKPIDVFISSRSGASAWGAQAVADSDGVIHTAWIDDNELKYAQRLVTSPVSARSWTNPITLPTEKGSPIGPLVISLDDANILHVVYLHAGAPIPGIYYLRSENGGQDWSSPVLISDPEWKDWPRNQLFYNTMDILPVNNTIHVVWEQRGYGFVYNQAKAHGREWSFPEVVPGADKWPDLVALDDKRLLLLTVGQLGDSICLKLQNVSQDGGRTWTTAQRTAQPAKGCLGRVNAMRDSDGWYHLFMSGRTAFTASEPERIWYTSGNGERWDRAQLVTWPGVSYETLGEQPDMPSAVISRGNILHAVFFTKSGKIWYTRRLLPASSSPAMTFRTQMPDPTVESNTSTKNVPPETMQTNPAMRNAELAENLGELSDQPSTTPWRIPIYYIGLISSGILLGVFLGWNLFLKKSGR